MNRTAERTLASLSPRERAVFMRIAQGETIAHIARAFGITHSTASTHRTRILRKLALTTNVEVGILAYRLHLLHR